MEAFGTFAVTIVLVLLGIFLMIAAYSRKPILLKIASLGTMEIDPDSPGRRQRGVMFSIGIVLIMVGLILIVIEKLAAVAGA
jgi:hypothetical protein